jgi:hypothetical protein
MPIVSTTPAVSIAQFRADLPAFQDKVKYPDGDVMYWLAVATIMLNPDRWPGQPPTYGNGVFTFMGNPVNGDTLILNGTVVIFVTGTPSGSQVQIGSSLTNTLANLLTFLQASTDTQIMKFLFQVNGPLLNVAGAIPGIAANALTISETSAFITTSGSTLSNGSDGSPGILVVGVEMFVAHNLVIDAMNTDTAQIGGWPGIAKGMVSSESPGAVSINYDTQPVMEDGGGNWNLTTYGTRFLRLARMMGAGPIQIGPCGFGGSGSVPGYGGDGPAWWGPNCRPGVFG